MKPKYRVAFLSVVPSPYQRDIFAALARRDDVDVRVHYLEAAAPDSPWPEKPLPLYSKILRGFWFPIGSARCHVNLPLPDFRDRDLVVLNTMMSATAQWLMRFGLRRKPWVFWGERLAERAPGGRGALHNMLTAPLHRAAAIVGIGSLADRQYAARFPKPRHYSIPYHCELAPFLDEPRPPRDPAEIVYLFCGQMIARKGLDHLLSAFTTLAERHPNIRLLLAGREAELPTLLASLPKPVRERIEYAGFQPPEDLPRLFARADVFILPSRYDGWGVVVNQAIGAGLPVVCSDAVGAGHDLVEPEVNGLRFPAGYVPALTRCMERFAEDPGLATKWGAASRAKADDWTPDRGAEKWVDVFHEVLGKVKILFASSSSGSRGGGETFLIYLGEALALRGHEVLLWTSSHPRMDEAAARFARFGAVHRAEYTNTYDRPCRSLAALLDRATPARAAREWQARKPDIVHINKQNLEDGLDLLHAARLIPIPGICTIHITQSAAFLSAKGAWLRDWVSRRGLRSCRGVLVAVSEPRKADLEKFLGPGKSVVAIPNGVPIPPALTVSERTLGRAELGLHADELAILAVGRMTPQKRPLLFLETAKQILASVPDARFFWIGDGPLAADWDARSKTLGIDSQVRRLGWRDEVAPLLAGGDLLLHTAEYEGLPLAVLEAMAAGLPCAITDTLHREMPFLDETNSIRIDGTGNWIEILRDRPELSRRAEAARRLAESRFSTDTMAAAYEQLYQSIISVKSV